MQNQSEEKNSESITIPKLADNIGLGMVLSNETWKQLINASPGFVAFISPDFRLQYVNKAMASFLGSEPEQLVGKSCYDAIGRTPESIHDCSLFKIDGIKELQSSIVDDTTFGKVNVKVVPIQNADGNLQGCLHFIEPLEKVAFPEVSPLVAEKTVHSLVNAMPNPTIICDASGKIEIASAGFMEMTGITDKAAVTGSNFISFLAHDDIEKALIDFNSIIYGTQSKTVGQFMIRRTRRDSILTEVIMSPIINTGQLSSNIMLTFSDISEQLEMVETANKNQVRLNRFNKTFLGFSTEPAINIKRLVVLLGEMLGASSCSFSSFEDDATSSPVSWQSPFLLDFSPETVTPIIFDKLQTTPDDFVVLLKPQLVPYFQSNPLLQERFGIKTLMGITIRSEEKIIGFISVVFTFNFQLKSEDREFCLMIASALGIEATRIAKPMATEVNDVNYRELFDFFTDSIYIIDPEGTFIDVNSGAAKMFGFDREEIIGHTPEMLLAKDKNDMEFTNDAIRKAFDGESQEMEWWGIRKNGEVFPNDIVLNRGKYFGRDVVIAISRDITERKKVEEKLLNYNMELRELNQSKDKFFGILAHDLKNPFGGLLGFIDLLYEDIDELSTDQVKEYLQNIRTASYHTYSLLENLLEWSRIQTGKVQFRPSRFDLKEEIESILMVLETNAIRKNIKLVNKVQESIFVEADRNMIYSVIQNLTTNAIKFSNSNSEVIIDGKSISPELAPNKEGESGPPRKWYEISVTDTGIGIPEDIMPKLFKLDGQFSMAGTANEPGTGLGLILCKEMVEKNGGQIRVDSFQGQGSIFAFTLPLSEE
jgi:two-component system, sensor histidine kinase and response regulator